MSNTATAPITPPITPAIVGDTFGYSSANFASSQSTYDLPEF